MLSSSGAALSMTKRYDASMPGWQMRANDTHYVADFNGDGRKDLYVFKTRGWSRSCAAWRLRSWSRACATT